MRLGGHQCLDRHAALARGNRKRAAERKNPLTHADQAETERVIRLEPLPIVADADPRAAATFPHARRRFGRLDGDVDRCCLRMTEDIGERFLNRAIDREIGGLAGFAERVSADAADGADNTVTGAGTRPARRALDGVAAVTT